MVGNKLVVTPRNAGRVDLTKSCHFLRATAEDKPKLPKEFERLGKLQTEDGNLDDAVPCHIMYHQQASYADILCCMLDCLGQDGVLDEMRIRFSRKLPVTGHGRDTFLFPVCIKDASGILRMEHDMSPCLLVARKNRLRQYLYHHPSKKYIQMLIGQDEHNKPIKISCHKLVCWAFHGPKSLGSDVVCHSVSCTAKRACLNPLHLRWGSKQEDVNDKL